MLFKKSITKYNRKPDVSTNDITSLDIIKYKSPNKKYSIILSHFQEPLNCVYISFFCLTDRWGRIIEKFEYLISYSISKLIQWSPNSNFFTIPLYNLDCIGIYNVMDKKITAIPVSNIYKINLLLEDNAIHFLFNDENTINFEKSDLYPTKKYKIPDPILFEFNVLKWYDVSDYKNMFEEVKRIEKVDTKLEYLGFNEFTGEYPSSTDIEIFKVRRFAEYGHPVSIHWMNELKKNWGNNYYEWEYISKYLDSTQIN
jgi:hypothetical protein